MSHSSITITHQEILSPTPSPWLPLHSPLNPPSPPPVDARLTSRLDKIQEALTLMKPTIKIRNQLIILGNTNGAYCLNCGPLPSTSYCGLTCPLLRTGGWLRYCEWWAYGAKKDVRLYQRLVSDIDRFGSNATEQIVREWELTAADLLMRTKDSPNRFRVKKTIKTHPGFDKHWTFDKHWGRGSGPDVEFAPEASEIPVVDETKIETIQEAVVDDKRKVGAVYSLYSSILSVFTWKYWF